MSAIDDEHLIAVLREPSPHAKACPAWWSDGQIECECQARRKEHDDE